MLTSEELKAIEDQLGAEELAIKKLKAYSCTLTDAQLKACCDQIAAQHKKHYNILLGYLS